MRTTYKTLYSVHLIYVARLYGVLPCSAYLGMSPAKSFRSLGRDDDLVPRGRDPDPINLFIVALTPR